MACRTIPPHIRRALEERDRGCRFPGCGCRFTEAHHVKHWADGGETSLRNTLLLCRRHHRAVHEGQVKLSVATDGTVVFFTPGGKMLPDAPKQVWRDLAPVPSVHPAPMRRAIALRSRTAPRSIVIPISRGRSRRMPGKPWRNHWSADSQQSQIGRTRGCTRQRGAQVKSAHCLLGPEVSSASSGLAAPVSSPLPRSRRPHASSAPVSSAPPEVPSAPRGLVSSQELACYQVPPAPARTSSSTPPGPFEYPPGRS